MTLPPLGLYVHLPWCERKCPYCDFNSHETAALPENDYVAALLQDLESDCRLIEGRSIDTIFIGGGTPSLFSAEGIAAIVTGIGERLPVSANAEITLEANPGSAEASKFAGFRSAGVNRLSIGVQSFDDASLKALGRIHDGNQAINAVAAARAAQFTNINLDLMHGLPGQTTTQAAQDLQTAIEQGPSHLSWYQLTIEHNTAFYSQPPSLPVEDLLADIQTEGERLLASAGFGQYEVSAYSTRDNQCRHNLNYWEFGDYLGIGAGAHSKITDSNGVVTRYAKRRQPNEYLGATSGGKLAHAKQLTARELPEEFMMNALRLNKGFSPALFSRHTGLDIAVVSDTIGNLQRQGLLEATGQQVRTTALGRRFLDSVVGAFIQEG